MADIDQYIVRVLDIGGGHMPLSVSEIASWDYSPARVLRALRRMVADGTVFVNEGCGPRGSNVYGLTAWKSQ